MPSNDSRRGRGVQIGGHIKPRLEDAGGWENREDIREGHIARCDGGTWEGTGGTLEGMAAKEARQSHAAGDHRPSSSPMDKGDGGEGEESERFKSPVIC